MNHLKLFLIGLCVLAGIFLLTSCANQSAFCPEIKLSSLAVTTINGYLIYTGDWVVIALQRELDGD